VKMLFFRWLKFNAVGALGVCLQLSALAVLIGALGVNYLLATGMAVELTVVHNFLWHEYFTWRDRTRAAGGGVFRRLLTFNASNGLVSLGGNLLLMRLLVGVAEVPYVMANGIAILSCSLVNFLMAELMVFVARKRPLRGRGVRSHCAIEFQP
jgi:putative flippase GtrA